MALNKEYFKSPEDKIKAYTEYRRAQCRYCQQCPSVEGGIAGWRIQMCFTAWLESEYDACITQRYIEEQKKQEERVLFAQKYPGLYAMHEEKYLKDSTPIDTLLLFGRSKLVLKNYNITNIGEFLMLTKERIQQVKGSGPSTLVSLLELIDSIKRLRKDKAAEQRSPQA